MAMLMTLRRMGHDDITTHGFRSTFRDWAAETTEHAREVAEAALAHVLADKVEAAYRRGDLFEKRRRLMEDWAAFCSGQAGDGEVVGPLDAVSSNIEAPCSKPPQDFLARSAVPRTCRGRVESSEGVSSRHLTCRQSGRLL
jgi:hypothetical protein